MKRQDAEQICDSLLAEIEKHFKRYLICGSIRRKCENVGDIDIVAIPKPDSEYQFGEMSLSTHVDLYATANPIIFLNGKAIKRFQYRGIAVDLYLADEESFGTLVLIRTGSKAHNIMLTTRAMGKNMKLKAGGEGLVDRDDEKMVYQRTEDGILMSLLGRVPTPEERDWT